MNSELIKTYTKIFLKNKLIYILFSINLIYLLNIVIGNSLIFKIAQTPKVDMFFNLYNILANEFIFCIAIIPFFVYIALKVCKDISKSKYIIARLKTRKNILLNKLVITQIVSLIFYILLVCLEILFSLIVSKGNVIIGKTNIFGMYNYQVIILYVTRIYLMINVIQLLTIFITEKFESKILLTIIIPLVCAIIMNRSDYYGKFTDYLYLSHYVVSVSIFKNLRECITVSTIGYTIMLSVLFVLIFKFTLKKDIGE